METNKKIGVFLCRCGGNISQVVDLDRLKEFAKKQPGVECAEYQSFTCSSEGQAVIQNAIKEQDLDSVVIGCCTVSPPGGIVPGSGSLRHDVGIQQLIDDPIILDSATSQPTLQLIP